MQRKLRLQTVQTNLSILADLLEDQNPQACEALWNNLPYRSVQLHTVVAGKNIYNFIPDHTPFFNHQPHLVRRMETEPGTIFSPFPRSMFIKYGDDSEDHQFPPVARVREKDLDTLEEIGRLCWEGMYRTKVAQEVIVTRAEDIASITDTPLRLIEPTDFNNPKIQQLVHDLGEATHQIWLTPPAELEELISGRHSARTQIGSYGQHFSAIYFVSQESSRIANFINVGACDNFLRLSLREDLSLKTLEALIRTFCDVSSRFLRMCGQRQICNFYDRILEIFPALQTKDEFFRLFSAFTLYADRYHSWTVFLFPWQLGEEQRYEHISHITSENTI